MDLRPFKMNHASINMENYYNWDCLHSTPKPAYYKTKTLSYLNITVF
jgi:hypothetical protein